MTQINQSWRVAPILALAFIGTVIVSAVVWAEAQNSPAGEEQAVRNTLARFYEGWNAHDPETMVSTYAEDVDHINVFGEWRKGKASIREDTAKIHAGAVRRYQY